MPAARNIKIAVAGADDLSPDIGSITEDLESVPEQIELAYAIIQDWQRTHELLESNGYSGYEIYDRVKKILEDQNGSD